jgi:hypothetical protein
MMVADRNNTVKMQRIAATKSFFTPRRKLVCTKASHRNALGRQTEIEYHRTASNIVQRRLKLRYLAAKKRMIKLLPINAAKMPRSLHLFSNVYPRGW